MPVRAAQPEGNDETDFFTHDTANSATDASLGRCAGRRCQWLGRIEAGLLHNPRIGTSIAASWRWPTTSRDLLRRPKIVKHAAHTAPQRTTLAQLARPASGTSHTASPFASPYCVIPASNARSPHANAFRFALVAVAQKLSGNGARRSGECQPYRPGTHAPQLHRHDGLAFFSTQVIVGSRHCSHSVINECCTSLLRQPILYLKSPCKNRLTSRRHHISVSLSSVEMKLPRHAGD